LKKISLGSLSLDYRIEKRVSDTDLPAEEAVVELYRSGIDVSRIIKVFSIGGLGRRRRRVLVPTRWSITAVDDILGRWLYRRVRRYPEIDSYLVYEKDFLENRYVALLVPGPWIYEFMEAWYPGTFWNRLGSRVVVEGSAEFGRPRKEYADIGGCYYASRLATLEHLDRIGRQATVIIFREAYPGYVFPVGVWSVRESVRMLFRERPLRFDSLGDALRHVFGRLRTPRGMWRSEVSINPYFGCEAGCRYCYSIQYFKIRGIGHDWGEYIEAKMYLPRELAKKLDRFERGAVIGIGTYIDPYQPLEARTRLTRRVLKVLRWRKDLHLSILTRYPLILRDLRYLEPRTPAPWSRVAMLGRFAREGVETWIFYAPVMPGLNDDPAMFEEVVSDAVNKGVETIYTDIIRFRIGVRERLIKSLEEYRPDLVDLYRGIGRRELYDWYRGVVRRFTEVAKRHGIKYVDAEPMMFRT